MTKAEEARAISDRDLDVLRKRLESGNYNSVAEDDLILPSDLKRLFNEIDRLRSPHMGEPTRTAKYWWSEAAKRIRALPPQPERTGEDQLRGNDKRGPSLEAVIALLNEARDWHDNQAAMFDGADYPKEANHHEAAAEKYLTAIRALSAAPPPPADDLLSRLRDDFERIASHKLGQERCPPSPHNQSPAQNRARKRSEGLTDLLTIIGDAPHQSKLHPHDNKFHVGNGDNRKHYWLTPPALYAELDAEFAFDFDPCPHPVPEGFDGLTCEWGQSNYVNPPFGSIVHEGKKKGPTAWVRKAIAEQQKGKRVVLVYPVDKWVLMLIKAILGDHAQVRNLGDVRWLATEDGSQGKGTGRHIACFVLQPDRTPT